MSALSDRELCLRLADVLGLRDCPFDVETLCFLGHPGCEGGRNHQPLTWLLIPAGALAVLDHFENERREDGEAVWGVDVRVLISRRGWVVSIWRTLAEDDRASMKTHVNLARAIAEAALAALEA